MKKEPGKKNYAASVRTRLLRIAKERKANFDLILTRFALERLLYRLSISPHADRFLLKGAMLFALWMDEPHRPTRDLDLLGMGNPSVERLAQLFGEVCAIYAPEDGLVFDTRSVSAEAIREDNIYGGVRVVISAKLEQAEIKLQVDVGFGDSIVPEPISVTYPTLLDSHDLPAPHLRAYQKETVVAEKFEAMVSLGLGNSRMKDFYDLYSLSQTFEFEGVALTHAIEATFARRGTSIPAEVPVALSTEFADDAAKIQQWESFMKRTVWPTKSHASELPSLSIVVNALATFLMPLVESSRSGEVSAVPRYWRTGGPWEGDQGST
jgi:predicted nucleotidyltransferase component of viral defense system